MGSSDGSAPGRIGEDRRRSRGRRRVVAAGVGRRSWAWSAWAACGPQAASRSGRKRWQHLSAAAGDASFRIELAYDYGVTFSTGLLRRLSPLYGSKTWASLPARKAISRRSRARSTLWRNECGCAKRALLLNRRDSTCAAMGYDEARPREDDRAFEFAYTLARPPAPRVSESLATTCEVDYPTFSSGSTSQSIAACSSAGRTCARVLRLSNGAIGVSSGSGTGRAIRRQSILRCSSAPAKSRTSRSTAILQLGKTSTADITSSFVLIGTPAMRPLCPPHWPTPWPAKSPHRQPAAGRSDARATGREKQAAAVAEDPARSLGRPAETACRARGSNDRIVALDGRSADRARFCRSKGERCLGQRPGGVGPG